MAQGIWIDTTAALAAHAATIGAGPLAVDVEADSLHHYPDRVCLIQLSCGGLAALADPLAGADPRELAAVFSDRAVRKIVHAADYDLRVLRRDFGLEVRGLFDTMVAARLVGERAFGLAALLDKYLGVRLDKRHQRADWSRRPLSAAMREYALADTRHLESLATLLEARLLELGRASWLAEECAALERVRWSRDDEDPDAFRRVKKSAGLGSRELAVLRELYALRDEVARELDRPPGLILRDELLVELARTRPAALFGAAASVGLPRPLVGGAGAARIGAAVERGLAVPESELPQPRRGTPIRRDAAFEARMARLRARRDELAAQLDLDPTVLAPRSALEEIQERIDRGEGPSGGTGLRAWQAALLVPWLVDGG